MLYDPYKHHRRSTRLKGYDYTQPGAYFVTICTRIRECSLGEITDGIMQLSEYGQITLNFWSEITPHFPCATIPIFVIMPNHVHAIIVIQDTVGRGVVTTPLPTPIDIDNREKTSLGGETRPLPGLGQIVAYYKYHTTKQINAINANPGTRFWQRNYYEHIIRNERELHAIRTYIQNNPLKWDLDQDNPSNPATGTLG